jgi:hypothetical protein
MIQRKKECVVAVFCCEARVDVSKAVSSGVIMNPGRLSGLAVARAFPD